MGRAASALILAAALALAPAARAEPVPLPPERVGEAIDHYFDHSRDPGTYRALAGMGDPNAGSAQEGGYVPETERQRRLLAFMLGDDAPAEGHWYRSPGLCRIDHALQLAEARAERFGENHPYVRQWLRVQRAVFTPCRDLRPWGPREERLRPAPAVALPPPLATNEAGIARLQRDDRAWQAAALLFYRRDPGAERAFRAIARGASPYAPVARYMLAALPVRDLEWLGWSDDAGTPREAERRAQAALAEAQSILADPALSEVHGLAQGLIGFVGYHTGDAAARAVQVDSVLDALEAPIGRIRTDAAADERYARALADERWLHGSFADPAWWLTGAVPTEMTASRAMAEQARSRPLAAWLLFPEPQWQRQPWAAGEPRQGLDWRLERFAQERVEAGGPGSEAWAALQASFARSYEPEAWAELDALQAAIQAAPTDRRAAALGMLFYHRVRAALMYPGLDESYQPVVAAPGFAEALARLEAWPWNETRLYRGLVSSSLAFLVSEGRLAEARTLRDRLSPRGEGFDGDVALLLLAEDEDRLAAEIAAAPEAGQNLLNLMGSDALARLAAREDLPHAVRARFARVAWARLYALRRPIPAGLDALMRRLNPEIASGWASPPGARLDDRRLLRDVLASPGLNILIVPHQRGGDAMGYADPPGLTELDLFEHSDNNWWCAWQPDRHRITASSILYQIFFAPERDYDDLAAAGAAAALGPLLRESALWQAQDQAEQAALAAIPSAPQTLAEQAVAWRGRGPREGQDEALALAVRATRYGCQRQGGHGRWSEAAWTLLHDRFPGSPAAARTRWWFDCAHFTGGCERLRQEEAQSWRRWTGRRYWY